ncbi:hypothetical protein IB279_13655 [Ensifer sp. ENS06]|uniref:hypothetical protein n=1 Tax=Ensifer sp. ENS06 TaxID=2769276 RepID=UPI00177ECAA2|nr:hypothetical protein [Ensifer sp. ENS06]MBD9623988.1 hypothetical protein [Ensifer sp. ENS06]
MRHNLLGFAALAATVSFGLSIGGGVRDPSGLLISAARAQESVTGAKAGRNLGNGSTLGSRGTENRSDEGASGSKPDTTVDRTRLENGSGSGNETGTGEEIGPEAKPDVKVEDPGAVKDGDRLERSLAATAAAPLVESPVSAIPKASVPEITGNGSMTQSIPIDVPAYRSLSPKLALSYDSARKSRGVFRTIGVVLKWM